MSNISTYWSATGGLSVSSRSWCSSSLLKRVDNLFQLLAPAPCTWTRTRRAKGQSRLTCDAFTQGSFLMLIEEDPVPFIWLCVKVKTHGNCPITVKSLLLGCVLMSKTFCSWYFLHINTVSFKELWVITYFSGQLRDGSWPLIILHWTHIILHLCDLQQRQNEKNEWTIPA